VWWFRLAQWCGLGDEEPRRRRRGSDEADNQIEVIGIRPAVEPGVSEADAGVNTGIGENECVVNVIGSQSLV
jgi:hypothetical protein